MATTYKVEGMTCGGCVKSVTRVVGAALPGTSIDVSLDGASVTVDGAHTEAAVREAVEDAGFDFGGVV